MTGLPAGLTALSPVVVPGTVLPGAFYHRPGGLDTVTDCGKDYAELLPVTAALAFGSGCLPCLACWPALGSVTPPGMPRLRPAAPWPGNGAGYQSRLYRTDPAPSSTPVGGRC